MNFLHIGLSTNPILNKKESHKMTFIFETLFRK